MPHINLILGGARSGKSRLAEQRSQDSKLPMVYLATATAGDTEMASRIETHQQTRSDQSWTTIEEPLHLAKALEDILTNQLERQVILVDCLTLWLSNCLHANVWQEQKTALLNLLQQFMQRKDSNPSANNSQSQIIFVSNETGLGVVPMGELTRNFVDESGFLHQEIAAIANQVTLVVAGLPVELKTESLSN